MDRLGRVRRWQEAMLADTRRPAPGSLAAGAVGEGSATRSALAALPAPSPPRGSLVEALRRRRSSSGSFALHPPLSAAVLGTVLAAVGGGRHLATDADADADAGADEAGRRAPLTRVVVLARSVDGLEPGRFAYRADAHALAVEGPAVDPAALQDAYLLRNYDLGAVAAVLVVLARPGAVVDAVGARGHRLLAAEVGALAQEAYVTAADQGIGCGVALGFDPLTVAGLLGVVDGDTWPLLLVMLGHERPRRAGVSF